MADHHIATSEADYTPEEDEVLRAIAKHRQEKGRPFLSNIEILRFLTETMGYSRKKPVATNASELPIVRHRPKKIMVPTNPPV